MMYLIVGASGFIGSKLYNHFNRSGVDVKGAYHSRAFEGGIRLDLANHDFSDMLALEGLTHVFLCHGISNIDRCKTDRLSYTINVTNTIKLLECLNYAVPVYLSTDMVYHRVEGLVATEYARQKLEVESYIKANFAHYVILRLTKVFGSDQNDRTLLTSLLDSLAKSEAIPAATDMFISPVYVMDVVNILDRLVTRQSYGTFDLGGPEVLSRYDLSLRFAEFFGYPTSQIQKISVSNLKLIEPRPLCSKLDSKMVLEITGMSLTPLEKCFRLIKENYGRV